MIYDLFISHTSEDKGFVRQFVDKLQHAGLLVWYDENRIFVGDNLIENILEGLEESTIGIIILSKDFTSNKLWPIFETGILYSKTLKRKIIPILIGAKEEDIPKFLQHHIYLDLKDGQDVKWDSIISKIQKSLDDAYSVRWRTDTTWLLYKKLLSERRIDAINNIILDKLEKYIKIWSIDRDISVYKAIDIISCIPNNKLKANSYLSDDNVESVKEVLRGVAKKVNNLSEFNIKDSERKIIDELLISSLNKFLEDQNKPKPKKINEQIFEIIEPTDFSEEDLKTTLQIEKKVLRKDLISDFETVKDWYYHNNYVFIGIRNTKSKQVAAFITALPITDRYYNLFLKGEVTDIDVSLEDIRVYEHPDNYKLYLSSVCVNPIYEKIKNLLLNYLYECFINMLLKISLERKAFISELIAEASGDDCVRLMKILNIDIQKETTHNTLIYTSRLISSIVPSRSRYENILAKLYTSIAPT